jgi:RNA polymerase sigma-70 factor (ECF subfamily)
LARVRVELRLTTRKMGAVAFDHDQVRDLHARLVAGDRVASSDLAELVLPELVARLRHRWPRAGADAVHDAAVQVLVDYLREPERYDPSRSNLVSWLQMQAHGDLTNDYRSPKRSFHQRRVTLMRDDVEGEGFARNLRLMRSDDYPSDIERDALDKALGALVDDRDRRLLALLLDGDTSTAAAANVLGISHLPDEEQQAEVKRNKDRIKARVKRHLGARP